MSSDHGAISRSVHVCGFPLDDYDGDDDGDDENDGDDDDDDDNDDDDDDDG